MKHSALLLLFCATLFIACDKSPSAGTTVVTGKGGDDTELYRRLFDRSMTMKDYPTAIVAAQMILLTDSTLTAYQDSLPELYAASNNAEACAMVIDDVLKRHPDEERFLQVKAVVLQEQRDVYGMYDIYNKLYKSTGKLTYQYQIATIQFSTGELDKAMKTLDMLIDKGQHSKDSLDIFINEQQKQKVPILAAVLNFKGYIFAQKRDMLNARNHFEAALKDFPDFVMAQRNLQQLMSQKQR
jgi:tetratricopeptide (TPR) repeat protein